MNSFKKIAMGLLSYMPNEKDLKHVQQTMQSYEELENWHLYFWKHETDFIGVIGVKEVDQTIVVQHLALNPSYRNQGIGKEILKNIQQLYPDKVIVPTEATGKFIRAVQK